MFWSSASSSSLYSLPQTNLRYSLFSAIADQVLSVPSFISESPALHYATQEFIPGLSFVKNYLPVSIPRVEGIPTDSTMVSQMPTDLVSKNSESVPASSTRSSSFDSLQFPPKPSISPNATNVSETACRLVELKDPGASIEKLHQPDPIITNSFSTDVNSNPTNGSDNKPNNKSDDPSLNEINSDCLRLETDVDLKSTAATHSADFLVSGSLSHKDSHVDIEHASRTLASINDTNLKSRIYKSAETSAIDSPNPISPPTYAKDRDANIDSKVNKILQILDFEPQSNPTTKVAGPSTQNSAEKSFTVSTSDSSTQTDVQDVISVYITEGYFHEKLNQTGDVFNEMKSIIQRQNVKLEEIEDLTASMDDTIKMQRSMLDELKEQNQKMEVQITSLFKKLADICQMIVSSQENLEEKIQNINDVGVSAVVDFGKLRTTMNATICGRHAVADIDGKLNSSKNAVVDKAKKLERRSVLKESKKQVSRTKSKPDEFKKRDVVSKRVDGDFDKLTQDKAASHAEDLTNEILQKYLQEEVNEQFLIQYDVPDFLGEGGLGCLFSAKRKTDDQLVVAKFIKYEHFDDADWVYCSIGIIPKEIVALYKLDHPGIIKYVDHILPDSFDDKFVIFLTEFHGTSWVPSNMKSQARNPGLKMRPPVVLDAVSLKNRRIVCDLDACIDAQKRIPESTAKKNIVIDENYILKVIDFGSVEKIPKQKEKYFKDFRGTVLYGSPEIMRGKLYQGPEAEICVILYHITFKNLPFRDFFEIMKGKYVIPEGASMACVVLIQRMLQKDPVNRISMDEIVIYDIFLIETL
ncbi:hypothetical protein HK098_003401 [Nowakowskiella sp. JEL0407]|nr:hypothetical protein HK098_003401 [Nowakowskiella sp. JEL0407]